jgi:hypothetical protein
MAVDAVSYRSRRRRDPERERAEKAKKEKLLLGLCVVVLLALVALEGPKTLKKLHGSSTTAGTTTVSAPTAATAAPSPTGAAASTAVLSRFPAKDPFVQQLGQHAAPAPAPPLAAGPTVRLSHFVAKDPFTQQIATSAPSTGAGAPPTSAGRATAAPSHTSGASATKSGSGTRGSTGSTGAGDYIVVLASIPLSDGRGQAVQAEAAARARGIANVAIVNSSSYPTLRTGFYAVYSGPYKTLNALDAALHRIRSTGYLSAYTRRLAR